MSACLGSAWLAATAQGFDLDKLAPDSPEFIHTVTECAKLAFADRELYYADPDYEDVPLEALLSDEYNDARRKLVDPKRAAAGLTPGKARGTLVDGAADASGLLRKSVRKMYEEARAAARLQTLEAENAALKAQLEATRKAVAGADGVGAVGAAGRGYSGMHGAGASTMLVERDVEREWDPEGQVPPPKVGPETPPWMVDTVHLCSADRWGNLVSIVPSGGGIGGSPMIEGLGFACSTRGQMLTLEPGAATTLRGGIRPRTTLTPTVALKAGQPEFGYAFGSPGGDGQDQWSLNLFLRMVHFGLQPQKAIDMPSFSSDHVSGSDFVLILFDVARRQSTVCRFP
eukprot:SAG11_NODE_1554_length_4695_cov_1.527633_4_plen_343_part_00